MSALAYIILMTQENKGVKKMNKTKQIHLFGKDVTTYAKHRSFINREQGIWTGRKCRENLVYVHILSI
jgi:hypothetical protein